MAPEIESKSYEDRLHESLGWAMKEGSRYFNMKSEVFLTLREIVERLDESKIPYALTGALAMFLHGYERFTQDIDLLLTVDSYEAVVTNFVEHGFSKIADKKRALRDTKRGVRVDFLIAGEHPLGREARPVPLPDPISVSEPLEGIAVLTLPQLVEMKLLAGMSQPGRLKHIADVVEMIKVLKLPSDLSEKMSPYVRAKYTEWWNVVATTPLDNY